MTNQNIYFAETALKEVGNGPLKYRTWYYGGSGSGIDWCAVFVSWCANKLGVLNTLITKTDGAGCFAREGVAKGWGKWYENGTTPQVGDIITFCWNGLGYQPGQDKFYSNHVGIVVEVKNGNVYVVEGNTGGGSNNYTTVMKKCYAIKNVYINGYYRPNWKTASNTNTSTNTGSTTTAVGKESIKEVQRYLNKTYNTNCTADGIYGAQTKSALVGSLQVELNKCGFKLAVDGVYGQLTRSAVPNITKKSGSRLIYLLQAMLICRGYSTGGLDGIFGAETENAVRQFQKNSKITVDAIAGINTVSCLLA